MGKKTHATCLVHFKVAFNKLEKFLFFLKEVGKIRYKSEVKMKKHYKLKISNANTELVRVNTGIMFTFSFHIQEIVKKKKKSLESRAGTRSYGERLNESEK